MRVVALAQHHWSYGIERSIVYPPVRQFEQYEYSARGNAPVSPWQRAWLAAGALIVVAAVVASYAVAAST